MTVSRVSNVIAMFRIARNGVQIIAMIVKNASLRQTPCVKNVKNVIDIELKRIAVELNVKPGAWMLATIVMMKEELRAHVRTYVKIVRSILMI